MEATIRLAADLEIKVSSDKHARRVGMTVISGTNYDGPDTRKRDEYTMTPSTARMLSSALLGGAQEV
jgi:hypothetical protein